MYRVPEKYAIAATIAFTLFAVSLRADDGTGTLLTVPPESQGSSPENLTVSGEYLYFTADDGVHGRELWKLDRVGEASLVIDLVPGPEGGAPHMLQDVEGTLYFFSASNRLWATKGGVMTTRQVYGPAVEPLGTTSLGERLLFTGRDGAHGLELWASNGTPEATQIVREGLPGPENSLGEGGGYLVPFDGRIYFATADKKTGPTVWSTDGTPEGTKPLYDDYGATIPSAAGQSFQGVVIGDSLLFTAGGRNSMVWEKRRGVSTGRPIRDDYQGKKLVPAQFGRAGRTLLFQRHSPELGRELWGYREEGEGLHLVADLNPGPSDSGPYEHCELGRYSIFIADHPDSGIELWRTDGTTEGTGLLKDLVPGSQSSDPYQLLAYKDLVLFSCENYEFGEELWRTDGTTNGTVMIKDINPEGDAEPYNLTVFNGKVYFTANHSAYGEALWESDGTAEGTRLAARLKPTLRSVGSSYPRHLTAHQDRLYFTAIGDSGIRELWMARGDDAWPISNVNALLPDGHTIVQIRITGGELFVECHDTSGIQSCLKLDIEDGYAEEVDGIPLPDDDASLHAPFAGAPYTELFSRPPADGQWAWAGNRCCFVAHTPAHGTELWSLGNEADNPSLVLDIIAGPASSSPGGLISTGEYIFFRAEDINKGCELWMTDGTTAGTRPVADFRESPKGSMPNEFAVSSDGALFFVGQTWSGGTYLAAVKPPHFEVQPYYFNGWQEDVMKPDRLTVVGNTVYFVSPHPLYGEELWKTVSYEDYDGAGSKPNVALVRDIRPNSVYDAQERIWTSAKGDALH